MGQGIRPAIANVLAQKLGIGADRVEAIVGDTTGAPQHITAGSWGTATAIPAVVEAADKLLIELGQNPLMTLRERKVGHYQVEIERRAPDQPQEAAQALKAGKPAPFGPIYEKFVATATSPISPKSASSRQRAVFAYHAWSA